MRMAPREYAVARVKAPPKKVRRRGIAQVRPLQEDSVDLAVFVGGRYDWRGRCHRTEEFQQLGFGAIEVAV
jgi:hypothetical protein